MSRNFKYNKKSFEYEDKDNLLLTLYCKLVVLELFLKEQDRTFNTHSIPDKLKTLTAKNTNATITFPELGNELKELWCTAPDKKQSPVDVKPTSYPNMRYLRHESDFPKGESKVSTDKDLKKCLSVVNQIYDKLKSGGYEIYEQI